MGKTRQEKRKNKPYYIKDNVNNNNDMVKIDEKIIQESKIDIQKFKCSVPESKDCVYLTFDNEAKSHKLNKKQFHAFTLSIINISKIVNPEMQYYFD